MCGMDFSDIFIAAQYARENALKLTSI